MKHPSSRAFFAYWDKKRGTARAPDRADIDPAAVRGLLGDTPDAPLRELLTRKARLGRLRTRDGFVGTAEEFADFLTLPALPLLG